MRPFHQVADEVDALLAADEEVPVELAAELMTALPRDERERWLRILARIAWRPENVHPEER